MVPKHDILYVNFYTDGSAARKPQAAIPPVQPRKKPQNARRKKTLYLDPVAVCSLMVAAVMLIMMAVGLNEFQNARAIRYCTGIFINTYAYFINCFR